jgi:hypothetical protein
MEPLALSTTKHVLGAQHVLGARLVFGVLCGFGLGLVPVPSTAIAEEPVRKFLTRLQEEGLYDAGLMYLDVIAARGKLPDNMKEDLPLERSMLLQSSLRSSKTAQQRDERMTQIEKGYKDFLAKVPNSPRRSEVQTRLGDLLLERSQIALNESKREDNQANAEAARLKARQGYLEAQELYTSIVNELKPILESMQGDKIKATDTEGKALRSRYQDEYRQAQILQAKMLEFVSQTYQPESEEWKQWLGKAESALTQIIEKTSSAEVARRLLSLLYRGEIQRKLNKLDEARDSFSYVADNEGTGIFRNWRAQATAGIVRLDASSKAGKYEAAVQRGEETLKQATASDKNEPEWIDLQLAVAEARVAWLKVLDERKDENKHRNNRRAAREAFQAIIKKQGSRDLAIQESVRKAKEGLSQLGIETADKVDDKLPETKTFADAIKAGRERLDRAESADSNVPLIEQQLATAENKQALEEQLNTIRNDVRRDRLQAVELYERATQLYRDKDPRDDLLETRYLLSYLYLRLEKYWECAAIAQDLLISASGTERAEKAGDFARISLNKLLLEAAPESQLAFAPPLERLAKRLVQSSPDSTATQETIDLLTKLALLHKQYDKAESYLALSQGKGGGGASILGQVLWAEYRRNMAQHRADKSDETPEDVSLKQRAEKLLLASWNALDPAKADKNMIMGANSLATLYLANNRIEEAMAVLNDPNKGLAKLTKEKSDLDSSVRLDTFKTQLQAMVQSAGQGRKELEPNEVAVIVGKMKELSAGNDSLLTNSLRNLAFELQSRLEATKQPEEQAKLGNAFGVLIQQLIAVSDDVSTLDSAGTSIFVLASNMLKDPVLAGNAKPLMAIAEQAFSKVATKPAEELIAAKRKPEDFQYKLGMAKSEAGKHEEAHKIFVDWLGKNSNSLTIQVEAARNLQRWAGTSNVDLLKKAIFGAEPNAKKANQIWGWAQISRTTAPQMNKHKDAFFESRLNIARCRRLIGLTESGEQRKSTLEAAVRDIRQTLLLTPDMGGPQSEANFSKLLKELQQDLGRPPIGFEEFRPAKAN